MSIKFESVWGVLPAVVWVKPLANSMIAAETRGPWVSIDTKYENDAGVLAHELVHVKQFYGLWFLTAGAIGIASAYVTIPLATPLMVASMGVHGLLYKFVPWYSKWAEKVAYAVQAKTK